MLFLSFPLAGPLQSWGPPSPWDIKMTASMPTKSAVVGLIAACFGYKRGDPRIQELADGLQMAVRADRPGSVMEDFQTVHSNKTYMVSASGAERTGSGASKPTTLTIKRQYLQDAKFTVFLGGKEDLLLRIRDAMKAPVFLTYLGRKTCVLSEPLIPVLVQANSLYEALRELPLQGRDTERRRVLVEADTQTSDRGSLSQRVFTRRDRMIHGCDKNYAARKVISYYIDM